MSAEKTTMTGCARLAGVSLGLAVTLGVIAQPVLAQGDSGWSNQGLIYLLGPTLDGTSGVGPFANLPHVARRSPSMPQDA